MGLISFLKGTPEARRVFGERELKIIERQAMGVNLTQSERNRLSRDIRKKFEFIAEVARFKDDFKLKKGSEIKNMISETTESIMHDALFRDIEEIILYGSAASNTLTLRSDIGIAVKFKGISMDAATLFRKRILGKVNKRVDVQVYNILPEKVRREIDANGKKLYSRRQGEGQDKRDTAVS